MNSVKWEIHQQDLLKYKNNRVGYLNNPSLTLNKVYVEYVQKPNTPKIPKIYKLKSVYEEKNE